MRFISEIELPDMVQETIPASVQTSRQPASADYVNSLLTSSNVNALGTACTVALDSDSLFTGHFAQYFTCIGNTFNYKNDKVLIKRSNFMDLVISSTPHLGYALASHTPANSLGSTDYFNDPTTGRYIRLTKPIDNSFDIPDYSSYTSDRAITSRALYLNRKMLCNPLWQVGDGVCHIEQVCLTDNLPFAITELSIPVAPCDSFPIELRTLIYTSATIRTNTFIYEFPIPQETLEVHVQPFLFSEDNYFAVLASGWNWKDGYKVGFAVVSSPQIIQVTGEFQFLCGLY
jgi:hypothetical protein